MAHLDRRETLRLLMLQIGAALLGSSAQRSFGQISPCDPVPTPEDDSIKGFITNIYPETVKSAQELRQAYDLCTRRVLKEYKLSPVQIDDIVHFHFKAIRDYIKKDPILYGDTEDWGKFLKAEFTEATLDRQLKDKNWGKVCWAHWKDREARYPMPEARIFMIGDEVGAKEKLEGYSGETVRLTIFGQGFVAVKNDITIQFLEGSGGASFPATVNCISGTYRCGCIEIEATLPSVARGMKKDFALKVDQKIESKNASTTVVLDKYSKKFTVKGR